MHDSTRKRESFTLGALATRFDCRLQGDPALRVLKVDTLEKAGPDAIAFLSNPRYLDKLAATRAGAVILTEAHAAACPVATLRHPEPHPTYARIAALLHPPPAPVAGRHSTAVVAETARIAATAQVDAHTTIGPGSSIDDGVIIGPGCQIGADVAIGDGTRLAGGVRVLDRTLVGKRCLLHPGTVVGADGFGFTRSGGVWIKVPQVGRVVIGDDVEVGANTTIDRGALGDTVIEDGVKLDNLVLVAHNVRIGAHTVIAGATGIAGSSTIGRRCMIGGGVGIVDNVTIGDDVTITARTLVTRSLPGPGVYSGSLHAEETPRWRRNAARFRTLDELARRVAELERHAPPESDSA